MKEKNLNIYERLSIVRGMVTTVSKSSRNPFFKSSYADLNSVMEAIAPACIEANIIYTQYANIVDGADVLTTEIVNTSQPEDKIVGHTRLILTKNDMQAYGSAITYSRRYALVSMFGLEAIDDDGNVSSGKAKPLTATQSHNERINAAKKALDKAKKEDDFDTASDIYDYATKHGFVQIQDHYIQLFESNDKEGM
ncbi:MAG: ERF family protein [Candidatus Marinimicrobia bacterium]|jgi:hypothetical protein|nr:ERF family protein [Candidatus Neomarinimicrobiota bacterium]